MAAGGRQRPTRDARERTRAYQARQAFHRGQLRRRSRDNLIAGIAGGALILAVVAGQVAFFTAGPGRPIPSPTPTPTLTAPPLPIPTTAPTATTTP